MKIGILGGTFDPPHIGHLRLIEAAIQEFELDEVIVLPANKNPFKKGRPGAMPQQRMEMVSLLAKHNPKIVVSDMEITRGGLSYTVDTLGELQMVYPGDYWFILGADALKGFADWKNPQRILRLCRLAVAARPPIVRDDVLLGLEDYVKAQVDIIEMPPVEASSTDLRDKVQRGIPIGSLTTPEIVDYIKKNKLYK
ncbi:MAG: nicotinate (nicotinamide) nucleotide adenylyltransferase [Armatimonadetes bacterium Cent15-Ar3]|jgi:nicotinate-nucleotide adenylyltransferase|nr:MAG: nicotinate (nicotinamide) nucleotide adenylyltransferase [Armatimonadetes bacterium Cent15-Ar3]